jgi:biotin carboxyl carrier protein
VTQQDYIVDNATLTARTEKHEQIWRVTIDRKTFELIAVSKHLFSIRNGASQSLAAVVRHKDTYFVDVDSVLYEVKFATDESVAGMQDDHSGEKDKVFAPMPGKVVKILVAVGDEVTEKQPLVIVEAMKMENQIISRAKGRVRTIHFNAGDQVGTDLPIIEMDIFD